MPSVSDAAQDKAAEVRALLGRMTVPVVESEADERIPDPAYAALRELVEDVHPLHRWGSEYDEGFACLECGDRDVTSRSYPSHTGPCERTRDWTRSLSGTLYGAAMERLEAKREDGEMVFEHLYAEVQKQFYKLWRRTHDRDLAIMTALEAALAAQLEAANARVG